MNRTVLFLSVIFAATVHAETSKGIEGLLGFTNGDQLHGHYMGFSEKRLKWLRDDLAAAPEFELANIRRVILRNGQPETALKTSAHVATIQGDRIPGRIISLDEKQLVLETEFAGNLTLPRDHLGMLAPNPFGGKIFFQGPFSGDEWKTIEPANRVASGDERESGGNDAVGADKKNVGWTHSGAAWYWPGAGQTTALVLEKGIPKSTIIRFQVAWKSRMSLAIAFHSDFKALPEVEAEEAPDRLGVRRRIHSSDTSIYGDLFGNSYVLQLNPTHAMMYRSQIDDNGIARVDRMQTNFNNISLGENGSAVVEIRASRTTGEISLFVNDEFVAQWSEIGHLDDAGGHAHEYIGKGAGLSFLMQSTSCSARISDVIVAEWNGMPDAARSLQSTDHDVVLLTNGSDRFSGQIKGISDGQVSLAGRYGDFMFPLDEVSEIRFARNSLSKPEPESAHTMRLRFHPLGMINGVPLTGDTKYLQFDLPSCGPIKVDLSAVVIMEMFRGDSFLDVWDPEF